MAEELIPIGLSLDTSGMQNGTQQATAMLRSIQQEATQAQQMLQDRFAVGARQAEEALTVFTTRLNAAGDSLPRLQRTLQDGERALFSLAAVVQETGDVWDKYGNAEGRQMPFLRQMNDLLTEQSGRLNTLRAAQAAATAEIERAAAAQRAAQVAGSPQAVASAQGRIDTAAGRSISTAAGSFQQDTRSAGTNIAALQAALTSGQAAFDRLGLSSNAAGQMVNRFGQVVGGPAFLAATNFRQSLEQTQARIGTLHAAFEGQANTALQNYIQRTGAAWSNTQQLQGVLAQGQATWRQLGVSITESGQVLDRFGNVLSGPIATTIRSLHTNLEGTRERLAQLRQPLAEQSTSWLNWGTILRGVQFGLAAFGVQATVQGIVTLGKAIFEAGVHMEQLRAQLTAISGGLKQGNDNFTFLAQTGQRLGLPITDLVGNFTRLTAATKGTALEGDNTRRIFDSLALAGRAVGASQDQISHAFLAIEQMISKGTVSMEELRRQLGNAIPGAFETAARAMGMTTQQLEAFIRTGEANAIPFVLRLADQFRKEYAGAVTTAINTTQSELTRLDNLWTQFKEQLFKSGPATLVVKVVRTGMELLSGTVEENQRIQTGAITSLGPLASMATPGDMERARDAYRRSTLPRQEPSGMVGWIPEIGGDAYRDQMRKKGEADLEALRQDLESRRRQQSQLDIDTGQQGAIAEGQRAQAEAKRVEELERQKKLHGDLEASGKELNDQRRIAEIAPETLAKGQDAASIKVQKLTEDLKLQREQLELLARASLQAPLAPEDQTRMKTLQSDIRREDAELERLKEQQRAEKQREHQQDTFERQLKTPQQIQETMRERLAEEPDQQQRILQDTIREYEQQMKRIREADRQGLQVGGVAGEAQAEGGERADILAQIHRLAPQYGLDPRLVQAVVQQESGFNPEAESKTGAQGLMQLMPGTARQMGVKDPFDVEENLRGGMKYLAEQMKATGDNVALALARYNAGPGAVEKAGGVPPFPETQNYVRTVQAEYQRLQASPDGGVSPATTEAVHQHTAALGPYYAALAKARAELVALTAAGKEHDAELKQQAASTQLLERTQTELTKQRAAFESAERQAAAARAAISDINLSSPRISPQTRSILTGDASAPGVMPRAAELGERLADLRRLGEEEKAAAFEAERLKIDQSNASDSMKEVAKASLDEAAALAVATAQRKDYAKAAQDVLVQNQRIANEAQSMIDRYQEETRGLTMGPRDKLIDQMQRKGFDETQQRDVLRSFEENQQAHYGAKLAETATGGIKDLFQGLMSGELFGGRKDSVQNIEDKLRLRDLDKNIKESQYALTSMERPGSGASRAEIRDEREHLQQYQREHDVLQEKMRQHTKDSETGWEGFLKKLTTSFQKTFTDILLEASGFKQDMTKAFSDALRPLLNPSGSPGSPAGAPGGGLPGLLTQLGAKLLGPSDSGESPYGSDIPGMENDPETINELQGMIDALGKDQASGASGGGIGTLLNSLVSQVGSRGTGMGGGEPFSFGKRGDGGPGWDSGRITSLAPSRLPGSDATAPDFSVGIDGGQGGAPRSGGGTDWVSIAGSLLKLGVSLFGGGGGGDFGGSGPSDYGGGGAFAAGGDMFAGEGGLVGEEGPEWFIPKTSGTIVPAQQTAQMLRSGGGGGMPHITIHVHGAANPAEFLRSSGEIQYTMMKAYQSALRNA